MDRVTTTNTHTTPPIQTNPAPRGLPENVIKQYLGHEGKKFFASRPDLQKAFLQEAAAKGLQEYNRPGIQDFFRAFQSQHIQRVNRRAPSGLTPLGAAILNDHGEEVLRLLEAGASLSVMSAQPAHVEASNFVDKVKDLTQMSDQLLAAENAIPRLEADVALAAQNLMAATTAVAEAKAEAVLAATKAKNPSDAAKAQEPLVSARQKEEEASRALLAAQSALAHARVQMGAGFSRTFADILSSAGPAPHAGCNALTLAVANGKDQMVGVLCAWTAKQNAAGRASAGAVLDELDANGSTPLTLACLDSRPSCVRTLVQAGADVNKPDSRGWTPLIASIQSDQVAYVKLLIESGANVNLMAGGRHPLWETINAHQDECTKLLIKSGADVNARPYAYPSLLEHAAYRGSTVQIEAFLNAGAKLSDIHVQNMDPTVRTAFFTWVAGQLEKAASSPNGAPVAHRLDPRTVGDILGKLRDLTHPTWGRSDLAMEERQTIASLTKRLGQLFPEIGPSRSTWRIDDF